jgi:hypothetical protein
MTDIGKETTSREVAGELELLRGSVYDENYVGPPPAAVETILDVPHSDTLFDIPEDEKKPFELKQSIVTLAELEELAPHYLTPAELDGLKADIKAFGGQRRVKIVVSEKRIKSNREYIDEGVGYNEAWGDFLPPSSSILKANRAKQTEAEQQEYQVTVLSTEIRDHFDIKYERVEPAEPTEFSVLMAMIIEMGSGRWRSLAPKNEFGKPKDEYDLVLKCKETLKDMVLHIRVSNDDTVKLDTHPSEEDWRGDIVPSGKSVTLRRVEG